MSLEFLRLFLAAGKGAKGSFVWTSNWQEKEQLANGFRWVIGDGQTVMATRDPWLAKKDGYKVDDIQTYEGRIEKVADLFYPGTKLSDSD